MRRCSSLHARVFFRWKFSGACTELRCLFWLQIYFFLSLTFYLWGWRRRRTPLPFDCQKAGGRSGEGQARGNSQVIALPSTCPQWIFNGRHSSNASAKFWVYKNFWDAALWQWFFFLNFISLKTSRLLFVSLTSEAFSLSGHDHPGCYSDEPTQPAGWDLHPRGDDCLPGVCQKVLGSAACHLTHLFFPLPRDFSKQRFHCPAKPLRGWILYFIASSFVPCVEYKALFNEVLLPLLTMGILSGAAMCQGVSLLHLLFSKWSCQSESLRRH